jgi:Domain of unknown function (DUF5667)
MKLRSRRAADAFAAALEHPNTPMSEDDRQLVDTVRRLESVEPPVMRAAFVTDVRERLLREFSATIPVTERPRRDAVPVSVPGRRRIRRPGLVPVGAVAAIILGTATAVGAVSQQALPGDALYPVKRGIERVDVGLSRSDHAQGEKLFSQAGTRLAEIRALSVTRGDGAETSRLVADTLGTFRAEASDGAASLMADYRDHLDGRSIRDIRTFTASAVGQLGTIVHGLSPSNGDAVLRAVRTLQIIDRAASATCPSCSTRPPLHIPNGLRSALSLGGVGTGPNRAPNGPSDKAQRPGPSAAPSTAVPTQPAPTPGDASQPSGAGQSLPTSVPSLPLPTLPLPSGPPGTPALPLPSPPVQLP